MWCSSSAGVLVLSTGCGLIDVGRPNGAEMGGEEGPLVGG